MTSAMTGSALLPTELSSFFFFFFFFFFFLSGLLYIFRSTNILMNVIIFSHVLTYVNAIVTLEVLTWSCTPEKFMKKEASAFYHPVAIFCVFRSVAKAMLCCQKTFRVGKRAWVIIWKKFILVSEISLAEKRGPTQHTVSYMITQKFPWRI